MFRHLNLELSKWLKLVTSTSCHSSVTDSLPVNIFYVITH